MASAATEKDILQLDKNIPIMQERSTYGENIETVRKYVATQVAVVSVKNTLV